MKLFFGGGINENQIPHIAECATGSQNFDLAKDSSQLKPRSVFDRVGTAPNGAQTLGIMQLIKRDDSQTQLVQAGATVYEWNGASTFTSVGTCSTSSGLRDVTWQLGQYLIITDIAKSTVVKTWNGTSYASLVTGLGTNFYAKYAVVHKGRVWFFNVTTSTDTPHLMAVSAFEDPTSLSVSLRAGDTTASGGEGFYMLTPDLKPINGVVQFNKELVISTENGALYRLTGNDNTDFAWVNYYPSSHAVGNESMVNIGNDVMYMKKGGGIDLLSSVQQSSDISADDVSRYIPTTISGLSSSIAVYEQAKERALFFISGAVLVFFKDIFYGGAMADDKGTYQKLSPWSIYKTLHSTGFSVSCAKYMRIPGETSYTVYFGGPSGEVFDLNGTGQGGDGGTASVQMIRNTRVMDDRDGMDFMRHITRGTVQYRMTNEVNLAITLTFSDERTESTANIVLNGSLAGTSGAYWGDSIYYGGAHYYSQGFSFRGAISHKNFSHVGKGSGCILTVSAENALSYLVDHIELN